MSTGAGELDYTDAEALNFGAVFDENAKEDITVGGEVEFHLIQTEDEDKNFTFENEGEEGRQPTKEKRMRKCWTASSVKQAGGRRILELMKPDENGRYLVFLTRQKRVPQG